MSPRLVLVAGTTETARIEGLSAAGATAELAMETPSVDAELLAYGTTVGDHPVPVSPTGTPTPAIHTRAVRELTSTPMTVIDAGLARPTGAPTVALPVGPGGDVRESEPVPDAREAFESARALGGRLPDADVAIGETIPGGTTTALGVFRALGRELRVSSSLPENPIERKRAVVSDAFATSPIEPGGATERPLQAIRHVGDPVLAAVAGLAIGATNAGTTVTLAGGTQMLAAAAVVRAMDVDSKLALATTPFVAAEPGLDLESAAADLSLDLTVARPGFADGEYASHPALSGYLGGEGKEGVGMGWAMAHARRRGIGRSDLHERIATVYERVTDGS